jgi:hypothetical protein
MLFYGRDLTHLPLLSPAMLGHLVSIKIHYQKGVTFYSGVFIQPVDMASTILGKGGMLRDILG